MSAAAADEAGFARARMTIDLARLRQNWQTVRARAVPARCGAVVKHDAYGLGLEPVTAALAAAGCDLFWTASLPEALRVRALAPAADVLALEGLAGAPPAAFAAARILPVLAGWNEAVAAAQAGLPVAVMVDGGLCRLGLTDGEMARLAAGEGLPGRPDIRAFVTQLAHFADPRSGAAKAQLARVRAAVAPFGPGIPLSLCSSAGLFAPPEGGFGDMVRSGSALYGVQTALPLVHPVDPVVAVDAPVLRVAGVPAGTPVGYEGATVTQRESRIATLAIGYGDGLPRTLGCGRGHVMVNGRPAPFMGRLSMGLSMVDVTGLAVQPGGRAEIVGPAQSLEALAEAGGTIANALMTGLARALPRLWTGG